MNAREELALELFIGDNSNQSREQSVVDWEWFNESKRFGGRVDHYRHMADAALTAGYRKLEPIFAPTLTNDGAHEYTVSSDCDGSSVQHWRRKPKLAAVEDAQPWELIEQEGGQS